MAHIASRLACRRIAEHFTHTVRALPWTHHSTIGSWCSVRPRVVHGVRTPVAPTCRVARLVCAVHHAVGVHRTWHSPIGVRQELSVRSDRPPTRGTLTCGTVAIFTATAVVDQH